DLVSGIGNNPAATSDGRTIVFGRNGVGLMKVDADGRHEVQLASGQAVGPVITADDKYVIFASNRSGLQSPWIMPLEGGAPTQIVNLFAGSPGFDLSPDGKTIVFRSRDSENQGIVIACDWRSCLTPRRLPLPDSPGRVRWTP